MRALLTVVLLALGIGRVPAAASLEDLPLHVTEPEGPVHGLLVFWSGDTGWTGSMQGFADAFAARGYAVVGVSALRYFWSGKPPQTLAADNDRMVAHFRARWRPDTVILLGYSLGADTLPFAWPLMDGETRRDTDLIALLSPFPRTTFHVTLLGMLGMVYGTRDVTSAIEALPADRVVCILGERERDMACKATDAYRFHTVPGGHRYRDFDLVADLVIGAL